MTLSKFLSEYIFRTWYRKGKKLHGYYAATMVTFFVSGFWHGAGWTFVAWGVINGVFVCIASAMKRKGVSLPSPLAYAMTAVGVVACRVLFVSGTFSDALIVLRGMVNFGTIGDLGALKLEPLTTITLLVGIIVCWFLPNTAAIRSNFENYLDRGSLKALPVMGIVSIMFMISIMFMNKVTQFLYFQF